MITIINITNISDDFKSCYL